MGGPHILYSVAKAAGEHEIWDQIELGLNPLPIVSGSQFSQATK